MTELMIFIKFFMKHFVEMKEKTCFEKLCVSFAIKYISMTTLIIIYDWLAMMDGGTLD